MDNKIPDAAEARTDTSNAQQPPTPPAAPTVERYENGEGSESQGCGKQVPNNEDGPPHWTRYVEGFCAIALVLITGTYTYYASQQLSAAITAANSARDAVVAADRNFRADEQGRVGLSFPKFDLSKEITGRTFSIPMEVVNNGKTPALQVQIKGLVSIIENNTDTVDLPQGDIKHGYSLIRIGLLQPGQVVKDYPLTALDTSGTTRPVFNTPVLIDHVRNSTWVAVVHGRVTYRDIFGKEHWLTFCDNLNGVIGGTPECFAYNSSDENETSPQKK